MGTSVTNYNNELFPKIPMRPYKSKASTTMAPVISNENVTLTQIPEPWSFSLSWKPSFRNTGGWAATLSDSKEKRHHLRAKCRQLKDKNIASAL